MNPLLILEHNSKTLKKTYNSRKILLYIRSISLFINFLICNSHSIPLIPLIEIDLIYSRIFHSSMPRAVLVIETVVSTPLQQLFLFLEKSYISKSTSVTKRLKEKKKKENKISSHQFKLMIKKRKTNNNNI